MRDDTDAKRSEQPEIAVEHGEPGADGLTVATPAAAEDDGEPTDYGDDFVPA